MENVIHAFLGVFILALSLILGVNTIAASSVTRSAESAISNYVQRIEEANYNGYEEGKNLYTFADIDTNGDGAVDAELKGVIQKCIAEAHDNGYELTVKVSQSPNNSHIHYGSAELKYNFVIPLIHIKNVRQIIRDLT